VVVLAVLVKAKGRAEAEITEQKGKLVL